MAHETPQNNLPYRPCVGVMLLNHDGKIFCGERTDAKNAWQMPQGGMHDDEDIEAAARREMFEEIGVKKARFLARAPTTYRYDFPDYLNHHSVYKGKFRGQEQHWVAFLFEGEESEINLTLHNDAQGPEFSRWQWLEASEVLARIVPFKRAVYEAVLSEFAPLIKKLIG